MISNAQKSSIDRMAQGESLLRIGSVWYGDSRQVTVHGMATFSNKKVETLQPVRTEAALSFSSTKPPVDAIQVELVINYSHFQSHVQRLFAMTQISPVLPVMNTAIAALTMPLELNRSVYEAYGFVNDPEKPMSRDTLMRMYSSVPVQMKIDNLRLYTLDNAPRDIGVIVRLTRVLTSNSYGDRVMYVRTAEGAAAQEEYVHRLGNRGGDNEQIDAIASLFGLQSDGMRSMVEHMRNVGKKDTRTATRPGVVREVAECDLMSVRIDDQDVLVKLYGVETPVTERFLAEYRRIAIANGRKSENLLTYDPGISKDEQVRRKKAQDLALRYLRSLEGKTVDVIVETGPPNYYFWEGPLYARITDPEGYDVGTKLLTMGAVFPAYQKTGYSDEATLARYGAIANVEIGYVLWKAKTAISRNALERR